MAVWCVSEARRCTDNRHSGDRLGCSPSLICFVLLVLAACALPSGAQQSSAGIDSWYQGTWDSSIYNRAERPRTVALRVEVIDRDSRIPVQGAVVTLRGEWLREEIRANRATSNQPPGGQPSEFAMQAVSCQAGVVVFGLSWQKDYPWSFGRPEAVVDKHGNTDFLDAHSSWTRAVDDIEKVQEIEVVCRGFRALKIKFDFSHLLEFGQDKGSEFQQPAVFDSFQNAWQVEMRQPGVRYCVMDLGTDFADFGDKHCGLPDFFQRILAKDFGTLYLRPYNWFSMGEYPQSECGPYLVYMLQLEMTSLRGHD